jgi:hypothetical protein
LVTEGRPRPPPAFATRTSTRPPALDDPRNHRLDRLVVTDIDPDNQSGAARCLNLDHLEAFEHRESSSNLRAPLAEQNSGYGHRATTQAHAFPEIVNHFTH